MPETFLM